MGKLHGFVILPQRTFRVAVTFNSTLTFTLNITQTLLQVPKHLFSKMGITKCNQLQSFCMHIPGIDESSWVKNIT
jgi:hypothetical protein